jgi:hypothetical protein
VSGWSPFLDRPAETPVFLDPSGRRERRVRLALAVAVCASVVWIGSLAAGCIGFARLTAIVRRPVAGVFAGRPAARFRVARRSEREAHLIVAHDDQARDARERRALLARPAGAAAVPGVARGGRS